MAAAALALAAVAVFAGGSATSAVAQSKRAISIHLLPYSSSYKKAEAHWAAESGFAIHTNHRKLFA